MAVKFSACLKMELPYSEVIDTIPWSCVVHGFECRLAQCKIGYGIQTAASSRQTPDGGACWEVLVQDVGVNKPRRVGTH